LLAGLSVTTKAVERTAESIGADIEMRQQRELVLGRQRTFLLALGIVFHTLSKLRASSQQR